MEVLCTIPHYQWRYCFTTTLLAYPGMHINSTTLALNGETPIQLMTKRTTAHKLFNTPIIEILFYYYVATPVQLTTKGTTAQTLLWCALLLVASMFDLTITNSCDEKTPYILCHYCNPGTQIPHPTLSTCGKNKPNYRTIIPYHL